MHAALHELKAFAERSHGLVRVLLFTGKGGVGKTTTAAATALRCADAGLRTIVLSTDPAHSLADAFDVDAGRPRRRDRPQPLGPAARRPGPHGGHLGRRSRPGCSRCSSGPASPPSRPRSCRSSPGLDEIFSLSDIKAYADSGEWDVVVVDCAPTAETLRLLSLPEILRWYMDRVFPMSRKVNKVVSPLLGRVAGLPMPGDEVFGSAVAVLRPPRRRPRAAHRHRAHQRPPGGQPRAARGGRGPPHLHLPVAVRLPGRRRGGQPPAARGHHRPLVRRSGRPATPSTSPSIEEGFAPLPILRAELASDELVGIDALRGFAAGLYADLDPAAVLHPGEPLQVVRKGTGYELSVELPFADKDELELGRRDDELLIRVGQPPPGAAAARLAAPPRGAGRLPARRPPAGDLRRRGRARPTPTASSPAADAGVGGGPDERPGRRDPAARPRRRRSPGPGRARAPPAGRPRDDRRLPGPARRGRGAGRRPPGRGRRGRPARLGRRSAHPQRPAPGSSATDDGDDEPPVQRIPVS